MTGILNVLYNGGHTTTIVLDNRITGMTGHQDNPGSGKTLLAQTLARILDFFRPEEAPAILTQLGETLTFIVSQGLYPSLREPGRQALCYEFLENTDSESRAAIRKYQENPTVLADWMKRPFNRRWEDTLRTLVESGEVSAAELRTGC
jgi:Tfp pilus assembly pilus retraction ATPase PilT